MTQKKSSRLLFFTVCALFVACLLVPKTANAASKAAMPKTSKSKYISTYSLQSKKTVVYSDKKCTKKQATLGKSAKLSIYSLGDISAKCKYKSGKKTKTGYIMLESVTTGNYQMDKASKARKKLTVYKRSNLKSKLGKTSKSSKLWTVGKTSKAVQIIYKSGKTYQMGWVSMKNYSRYLSNDSSSSVWTSDANYITSGYYTISTRNNRNYVLDVANWGVNNTANVEICKKDLYGTNQHPNQRVYIYCNIWTRQCTIQFQHSGKYLTCNRFSGNAYQYSYSPTNNYQKFYFKTAPNGYYYIECVGNGQRLDNSYQNVYNGNNVLFYSHNSNYCQQWRLNYYYTSVPVRASADGVSGMNSRTWHMAKGTNVSSHQKHIVSNYPVRKISMGIYKDTYGSLTAGSGMVATANVNGLKDFNYRGNNLKFKNLNRGMYYFIIKIDTYTNSNVTIYKQKLYID